MVGHSGTGGGKAGRIVRPARVSRDDIADCERQPPDRR